MLTGPLFRYLSGGLVIALLLFIGLWKMEQRRAGKLSNRVIELTELRKSDRLAYELAQIEAADKNRQYVEKIEERNEAITNRVRSDYQRDLDRLRSSPRPNPGAPRGPGVSGVPKAPGRIIEDGLPSAPCDHLCASEIELRLMHLQNWVLEQARGDSRPQ